MNLHAWGKRATLRTAKTLLPPRLLRRILRTRTDYLWMRVAPTGPWPLPVARFTSGQFSGLPPGQGPVLAVVVRGKHPTLDALRRAVQDASAPAPPRLQQLQQHLADIRRGQQGVIEQNAYLTGRRERPAPIAEDAASLSLPPVLCRLLYYLVRHLRPAVVVELGTAHGVSALHMLTAMEEATHGQLHTIDGDPARRALALENLRTVLPSSRVTSHEGYFSDVLPAVLGQLGGPMDLAFDDGDHFPESTMANFRLLFPRLRSGAVLVVDDINHPTGNVTAWRTITRDPGVAGWVEINARFGICIKA